MTVGSLKMETLEGQNNEQFKSTSHYISDIINSVTTNNNLLYKGLVSCSILIVSYSDLVANLDASNSYNINFREQNNDQLLFYIQYFITDYLITPNR